MHRSSSSRVAHLVVGLVAGMASGGCQNAALTRFAVHGGQPGTTETPLPPVDANAQAIAAVDVDPKDSTVHTPTVVFERTAPNARSFPAIPLQYVSRGKYELVVPREGFSVPGGSPSQEPFAYPSDWKAHVDVPFDVRFAAEQHLTQSTTFHIGPGANCLGFDAGLEGWEGDEPIRRFIPSLGVEGQPSPAEVIDTVAATAFTDVNWPTVFPGTGSIGFRIPPGLANASNELDEWFVSFSGPTRPGMLDADGVELHLKGIFVRVQVGVAFSHDRQTRTVYGPLARFERVGEWLQVRALFPQTPDGWTRASNKIRIRLQAPIHNVQGEAGEAIVFDHVCSFRGN